MKIKPIFLATGKNGDVRIHQKQRFVEYVQSLGDGIIEITACRRRRTRTLEQNAYLWGVVYPTISDWNGHTSEENHDILKSMFLKRRIGKYVVVGSTAKLTTVEFGEYIDKIIQWAGQEGVEIPLPDTIDME